MRSTTAFDSPVAAPRRRILYLTHRVPYPPDRGDRIRSYHTLRFLSARADIDLACLADEPVNDDCRRTLETWCRRVAIVPLSGRGRWAHALASMARGKSATVGLFYSKQLKRVLENWSATTTYDWIIAYCSSMAPYLKFGNLGRSPQVVDLVDVDSQKWFDYSQTATWPVAWLFRWEGNRVRKLERQLALQSKMQLVVSDAEANLYRQFCPQANVHSLPNGVDLDHFRPVNGEDETRPGECVFVGALDYRANVDGVTWFCNNVWPQVYARYPQSRFVIVGRNPTSALKQLATQPGVELVGPVRDVVPYLQRAQMVVVPLRIARGIQNKVLEALAVGKPVIASPQALEGLAIKPGEHAVQADTPSQWATAIFQLMDNAPYRRRLASAGRMLVCKNHHWENCLAPLAKSLDVHLSSA